MWPLVVLLFAMSLIGSVNVLFESARTTPAASSAGTPTALADNFFVYANAVGQFVSTQSTGYTAHWPGNAIPNTSLTFPSGFNPSPMWRNSVINGTVTIFAHNAPQSVDLSLELAQRTGGAFRAGIVDHARGREIVSLIHGPTGVTVPPVVPDRSPAFQFTTR